MSGRPRGLATLATLAAVVMAAVLLDGGEVRAQASGYEGVGQAPVVGGDRVKARNRALDEAFRNAIDNAAAALFDPPALAQRQSALKLTVEPKARSYVTGYRILEEGEQGGTFRVRVGAELAIERLEKDLGGRAAGDGGFPSTLKRIGNCLHDRAGRDEGPAALGSIGPFLDAVSDPGAAFTSFPCPALPQPPLSGHDPVAIGRAAREARLAAVLLADLSPRATGPVRGTSLTSAHVDLRVELIDAEGRLLASSLVGGDGYGEDVAAAQRSAARSAFEAATESIRRGIQQAWPRRPPVRLLLPRLERWSDVAALQRALAPLAGNVPAEPTRLGGDGTEVTLPRGGDPQQIVAALSRPPASPTAPRFTARVIDATTIAVEVIAPPPPSVAPPGASSTLPAAPPLDAPVPSP